MCKSVRGAAFFGSSIHLGLSFVFLSWFVFDTLISEIDINLWKCDPPEIKFRDIEPLAHYLNVLFKLFYFIALFVTGIYIFRGVERERPRTLKFATLGFVILQIIGLVFFSILFTIQWNTEHRISLSSLPEPASQTAEEAPVVIPATVDNPCKQCTADIDKGSLAITLSLPPSVDEVEVVDTVTPMVSENVLPAPDFNDTTTTTPIPMTTSEDVTTTTSSTASPATTTTTVPDSKPPPMPPHSNARQRLPHNLLVSLVFQMCFAVTNGVGSVVYVIVLALYMLKL